MRIYRCAMDMYFYTVFICHGHAVSYYTYVSWICTPILRVLLIGMLFHSIIMCHKYVSIQCLLGMGLLFHIILMSHGYVFLHFTGVP